MSIWTRIAEALSALASGEGLSVVFDRLRAAETTPEKSVGFTIAVIALGAKMAKADGEVTREVEVECDVKFYRTTMRYTFTNARPEPVVVEMTQGGLDRGWWTRDFRVVSEDVEGEQLNRDTRLYRVTVPANGERVVNVTYETKF